MAIEQENTPLVLAAPSGILVLFLPHYPQIDYQPECVDLANAENGTLPGCVAGGLPVSDGEGLRSQSGEMVLSQSGGDEIRENVSMLGSTWVGLGDACRAKWGCSRFTQTFRRQGESDGHWLLFRYGQLVIAYPE